jgi:hypothetical protein
LYLERKLEAKFSLGTVTKEINTDREEFYKGWCSGFGSRKFREWQC